MLVGSACNTKRKVQQALEKLFSFNVGAQTKKLLKIYLILVGASDRVGQKKKNKKKKISRKHKKNVGHLRDK